MILAAATLEYNLWTDLSFWSFVAFFLLAEILVLYLAEPIGTAMKNRQAGIVEQLQQSEIAQAEARQLQAQHEEARARIRVEATALLEEAKRDANETRKQMVALAHAEAERLQRRVQRDIDLLRRQANMELFRSAAALATRVAERVLREQISAADQERLIAESIRTMDRTLGEVA